VVAAAGRCALCDRHVPASGVCCDVVYAAGATKRPRVMAFVYRTWRRMNPTQLGHLVAGRHPSGAPAHPRPDFAPGYCYQCRHFDPQTRAPAHVCQATGGQTRGRWPRCGKHFDSVKEHRAKLIARGVGLVLEGRPIREVAAEVGVSRSTLSLHVRRARKAVLEAQDEVATQAAQDRELEAPELAELTTDAALYADAMTMLHHKRPHVRTPAFEAAAARVRAWLEVGALVEEPKVGMWVSTSAPLAVRANMPAAYSSGPFVVESCGFDSMLPGAYSLHLRDLVNEASAHLHGVWRDDAEWRVHDDRRVFIRPAPTAPSGASMPVVTADEVRDLERARPAPAAPDGESLPVVTAEEVRDLERALVKADGPRALSQLRDRLGLSRRTRPQRLGPKRLAAYHGALLHAICPEF
jgi:transposase